MKKIVLTTLMAVGALTATAQYQFPNSDFESDFVTAYVSKSYTEPEGWHGYATIDASSLNNSGRSGSKLCMSTDVREGADGERCVYIVSTSIMGVIANGVMTNGQIYTHSTTATDGKNNYNFSDQTNTGSADTYGDNNEFFTEFTGRPDSMKVWIKFQPASSGTGNASVSVYLHKANTVMYDPTDNVADESIIVAHAGASIEASDEWVQYSIPFTYQSDTKPGLILATFTTNETPGGGSKGDYLYIDDIEMVYDCALRSATYSEETIAFTDGKASLDAIFSQKLLSIESGAGATWAVTTEPTADNDYTATITISGANISEDPTNYTTVQIQFTGAVGAGNDEADAEVEAYELTTSDLGDARYYIYNISQGAYLNDDNTLTETPEAYWTISQSAGTIINPNGGYLLIDRSAYASSFNASNFYVETNANWYAEFTFEQGDDYVAFYRDNLKYYNNTFNKKYADTYLCANSLTELSVTNGIAEESKWLLYRPVDIILASLTANYAEASTTAPLTYDLTPLNNDVETVLTGAPLGLYAIDGGEIFYLASDEEITVTKDNTSLTYYGRLNLAPVITYDDADITSAESVDAVYQASKLTVVATGNGAEQVLTAYDESSCELTVIVTGYGRANEYVIAFAQPDLTLTATWDGVELADGITIDDSYDDADTKLVITAEDYVTVATAYDDTTLQLTITLSYGNLVETYVVTFAYATAIEAVATEPTVPAPTAIYSLAGQKLSKPVRGLNIINGKKVIKQ